MKKSARKILSLLLVAAMLFSFGAVSAFAEETEPAYEITYGLLDEYVGSKIKGTVKGYENSLGEDGLLEIPASYSGGGIKVLFTEIAEKAFAYFNATNISAVKYNKEIKEVVVADGIEKVGTQAFCNLAKLEKITFKGDIVIDEAAFEDCKNLKTVIFEGKNVTVGANAFAGCTALSEVSFVSDVELTTGVNAFNDTKWFSEYPTDFIIAGTTLVAYTGSDAAVSIPLSIEKIGNGAFKGNANLESVELTENIVSVGDEAFMDCAKLTKVIYSEFGVLENIGIDVFKNTPYYDAYEGDFFRIGGRLIKYLGNDVDVVIPNTVTEIAAGAFDGCYTKSGDGTISYQISSIRVPASVKNFEDGCFTLYSAPSEFVPVLYVYSGTDAAAYVAEKGYNHIVIGTPGDVDVDSTVSPADARLALRAAVGLDALNATSLYMGDMDGDLLISVSDARTILRIAVGLEEVSFNALLSKPSTPTEILDYYADVLEDTAKLRAGYTKKVTGSYAKNNTAGCSLDLNTYMLYLSPLMDEDSSVVNSSRAYESNTEAAVANFVSSDLISTDAVQSASCLLRDGKYYITIVLNAEEAVTDDTFVSDIYPVAGRSHFDGMLNSKSWYTSKLNWLTYDLFYKNCKVTAVIDAATDRIESLDMSVTYSFENIDGKLGGLDVTNYGRTSGTGFATRNDTISFSNFVY